MAPPARTGYDSGVPEPIGLAACAIGVVMILAALRVSRLVRESRGYTRAAGRILVSRVDEFAGASEEGGVRFRPVVRYAFEARGRTWESERISFGEPPDSLTQDERDARQSVARYPANTAVDVWFDPADPRRSVLVRGGASAPAIVAVITGLALVGVGLFALSR